MTENKVFILSYEYQLKKCSEGIGHIGPTEFKTVRKLDCRKILKCWNLRQTTIFKCKDGMTTRAAMSVPLKYTSGSHAS